MFTLAAREPTLTLSNGVALRIAETDGWVGGHIWESGRVLAKLLSAEPVPCL